MNLAQITTQENLKALGLALLLSFVSTLICLILATKNFLCLTLYLFVRIMRKTKEEGDSDETVRTGILQGISRCISCGIAVHALQRTENFT